MWRASGAKPVTPLPLPSTPPPLFPPLQFPDPLNPPPCLASPPPPPNSPTRKFLTHIWRVALIGTSWPPPPLGDLHVYGHGPEHLRVPSLSTSFGCSNPLIVLPHERQLPSSTGVGLVECSCYICTVRRWCLQMGHR